MGRKWISAVKKIFGAESKECHKSEKQTKKRRKSKDSRKSATYSYNEEDSASDSSPLKPTTTTPVVAADVVASAIAEVESQLSILSSEFVDDECNNTKKEVAAIKIQAAFRGYLGRRGTTGLRGMVRLKLMAGRNAVKRQTINTLHNMQVLMRIRAQVKERRIKLSEENQALHRQRQLKREKELQKSKLGEDWVDSPKSKEQIEAKLQKKQEAVLRRERTLAYAYSHQWRNKSARSKNPSFIDQTNPHWGWSWLERWMATRPWETRPTIIERDRSSDLSSVKSSSSRSNATGRRFSAKFCHSPSMPPSITSNEDLPSLPDIQSGKIRRRRHSLGGSFCFRDQEESRAKLRPQVPGKPKAVSGVSLALK